MNKRIRVLISENRADTRELIKRCLEMEKLIEISGEADTGPAAVREAIRLKPDIVLMYADMREMSGFEACERIMAANPSISVILLSPDGGVDKLKRAMTSGAKDFIVMPLEPNELVSTIRLVYKKRAVFRSVHEEEGKRGGEGRVVGIYSTKGGVGKTTIAFNLAVAMAQRARGRIALADMDFEFGDVAIMADVEPERTFADLMEETGTVESDRLSTLGVAYLDNLDIYAAPPGPEYAEYIAGETVKGILEGLRRMYDYVLVDTGNDFGDVSLGVLDHADVILMVSPMDIVSAKNVKIGLEIMKSLEYPEGKIELLVNMADERLGVGYADFERIFQKKIRHKIPYERKRIVKAMNRGVTQMGKGGSLKVKKAFERIAKDLMDR